MNKAHSHTRETRNSPQTTEIMLEGNAQKRSNFCEKRVLKRSVHGRTLSDGDMSEGHIGGSFEQKGRVFPRFQRGFTLIEVILATAIFALVLSGTMGLYYYSNTSLALASAKNRALLYAQEGIEAMRNIRDTGFHELEEGTYGITSTSGSWALQEEMNTSGDLTRSIAISAVNTYTKLILVTVSWKDLSGLVRNIELATELSLWKSHTWLETLVSDFTNGTHSQTSAITDDEDGAIELEEMTLQGDWCNPSETLTEYDLPGSGIAASIHAVGGSLFLGTGANASGLSFFNTSVSPGYPPSVTTLGTFDGAKTNSVFGENAYGYIATDTNQKEIIIIDLSANPYTEIGYFDAPGSTDAETIFVAGNYGYMTAGNTFRIFDLTSKSGSRSEIGNTTLAGTGKTIKVVGNYAFIAINSSSTQMQIVDITNPAIPNVVGQAQLSGSIGRDIDVSDDGNTTYLVTSTNASGNEFFIINTTTKTGNQPMIGSAELDETSPYSVTRVTNDRVIVAGIGGTEQYIVFDATNEASPSRCGGMAVTSGINDVAGVTDFSGNAFSYVVTGDASNELKIILGGTGGGGSGGTGYAESGIYTSPVFDTLNTNAHFYFFFWRVDLPTGTGIAFQIRTGTSGNLSTESWLGPDNTSDSWYTQSNIEPIGTGAQEKRYIQYRAKLTTPDPNVTPLLRETRIYYQ